MKCSIWIYWVTQRQFPCNTTLCLAIICSWWGKLFRCGKYVNSMEIIPCSWSASRGQIMSQSLRKKGNIPQAQLLCRILTRGAYANIRNLRYALWKWWHQSPRHRVFDMLKMLELWLFLEGVFGLWPPGRGKPGGGNCIGISLEAYRNQARIYTMQQMLQNIAQKGHINA